MIKFVLLLNFLLLPGVSFAVEQLCTPNCSQLKEKAVCEENNCLWEPEIPVCLSKLFGFCSSYTTEPTCKELGCLWDKTKTKDNCMSSYSFCSSFTSKKVCRDGGCKWAGKKCESLPLLPFYCADYASSQSCLSKGCAWDEEVGCLTTYQQCNNFTSMSACLTGGCIWDEKNGCLSSALSTCQNFSTETGCQKAWGCSWKVSECQGMPYLFCSSYQTPGACQKSDCVWKDNSCASKHSCSNYSDSTHCAREGCLWDDEKNKCANWVTSSCSSLGKTACEKRPSDCFYFEKDQECKPISRFLNSFSCGDFIKADCKRLSGCIWDPGTSQCRTSKLVTSCSTYSSKTACQKGQCQWDGATHQCLGFFDYCRKFDADTCPTESCKVKNNSCRSKTCIYQRSKESCQENEECTWLNLEIFSQCIQK